MVVKAEAIKLRPKDGRPLRLILFLNNFAILHEA